MTKFGLYICTQKRKVPSNVLKTFFAYYKVRITFITIIALNSPYSWTFSNHFRNAPPRKIFSGNSTYPSALFHVKSHVQVLQFFQKIENSQFLNRKSPDLHTNTVTHGYQPYLAITNTVCEQYRPISQLTTVFQGDVGGLLILKGKFIVPNSYS